LAIAQYKRDGFPHGAEHWSLVAAAPGNELVDIFEIVGNTDTYTFSAKRNVRISRSRTLRGGCKVGEIDTANIGWLEDHLATSITIIHNDPNWHCQTWVIEAIRELQQ
ncbi:hypothetical protein BD414DRAFT_392001, partial [Trametes punicea]